ncbi:hypothetical protein GCM10025780_14170 [Frondihabitans cladoniiphilus]|uniref:Uncharacterized protein n=1 Tax=Frondihabitans cladoniiphilus TaxID=715785 RepID=A0ABP8VU12_9MICO
MLGEPADPGEHVQRREVEVRPLAVPRVDDAVDLVLGVLGHLFIMAMVAGDSGGSEHPAVIWQTGPARFARSALV